MLAHLVGLLDQLLIQNRVIPKVNPTVKNTLLIYYLLFIKIIPSALCLQQRHPHSIMFVYMRTISGTTILLSAAAQLHATSPTDYQLQEPEQYKPESELKT